MGTAGKVKKTENTTVGVAPGTDCPSYCCFFFIFYFFYFVVVVACVFIVFVTPPSYYLLNSKKGRKVKTKT
jgi:hypothetical protein